MILEFGEATIRLTNLFPGIVLTSKYPKKKSAKKRKRSKSEGVLEHSGPWTQTKEPDSRNGANDDLLAQIAELEARIDELCGTLDEADANVSEEVEQLRKHSASIAIRDRKQSD